MMVTDLVDGLLPHWISLSFVYVPMIFGFLASAIPAAVKGIGSLFGSGGDGGGGGDGGFDLGRLLAGAAPGAVSLIGSLLGGAPSFDDLPAPLKDMVIRQSQASQRAESTIEDQRRDIDRAKQIDTANLRSIGAFDPTSLGPEFGFLQDTVNQFSDVDRSALPLRRKLDDLARLNQQNLSLAGQGGTALGANQQLLGAQSQFAQGVGGGASGILQAILGQLFRENQRQQTGGGGGTALPFDLSGGLG